MNAIGIHARELPRTMPLPLLATKLMGMTGYGPASFHDLLSDDDLLTEGSSIGDVSSLGCPVLRECVMADVQGPQPVLVETWDTHTPPDPSARRGPTLAARIPATARVNAPLTQLQA
jgi:hypothetical protein